MLANFKHLHCFKRLVNPSLRAFSGHAPKAYDWRDDPKYNPDLFNDARDSGWNHEKYDYPYTKSHDGWHFPTIPDNYKITDLTTNLYPENKKCDKDFTSMRVKFHNF